MKNEILVIIPARIGSTRLEKKPLKKIGNMTMIEHICKNLTDYGIKNFYIATDSEEISEYLANRNYKVIMTDSDLESGTDRVFQAWKKIDESGKFKFIINVQGDMPFLDPKIITDISEEIIKTQYDILTPVTKVDYEKAKGESNVKVVINKNNQALYFSRSMIPNSSAEYLYHVGVYAFKDHALKKFVSLPKSDYERSERLEQLRALENNMSIGIIYSDSIPISIDTEDDYKLAIDYYNKNIISK